MRIELLFLHPGYTFVHWVTLLINSSVNLNGAGVLLPCSSAPPERFGVLDSPAWLWCLSERQRPGQTRLWPVSPASHSNRSSAGHAHDSSVAFSQPVHWNKTATNNIIKHSPSPEIHTTMYCSLLTKMLAQHSANFTTRNENVLNTVCDIQLITQDQRLITAIVMTQRLKFSSEHITLTTSCLIFVKTQAFTQNFTNCSLFTALSVKQLGIFSSFAHLIILWNKPTTAFKFKILILKLNTKINVYIYIYIYTHTHL